VLLALPVAARLVAGQQTPAPAERYESVFEQLQKMEPRGDRVAAGAASASAEPEPCNGSQAPAPRAARSGAGVPRAYCSRGGHPSGAGGRG